MDIFESIESAGAAIYISADGKPKWQHLERVAESVKAKAKEHRDEIVEYLQAQEAQDGRSRFGQVPPYPLRFQEEGIEFTDSQLDTIATHRRYTASHVFWLADRAKAYARNQPAWTDTRCADTATADLLAWQLRKPSATVAVNNLETLHESIRSEETETI